MTWIIINLILCIFLICLLIFQNVPIFMDIHSRFFIYAHWESFKWLEKKLLKETLWMHILGTIYNSCRVIKCYLNKLCLFYPRTKFSITFACVPSYYSDQPSHLHCLIWSYYGYWGPLFLHATNWRSSQTAWLCRHVWVFAGCLCGFVGIAVLWLSFHLIWKLLDAS